MKTDRKVVIDAIMNHENVKYVTMGEYKALQYVIERVLNKGCSPGFIRNEVEDYIHKVERAQICISGKQFRIIKGMCSSCHFCTLGKCMLEHHANHSCALAAGSVYNEVKEIKEEN